jgi:LmbE family N-acetylglucosaminyl deacetylase
MTTLLSVWAHPDDETFGPAALFRSLHEQGIRLVVVTATRGEAGNLGNPPKATPETLADVRSAELHAACGIMGVDRLEIWDYADGKLAMVEASELRDRILALLVEESPSVVMTFGPDGIYGHPDHLAIHAATTQAFAQYVANHTTIAAPRLYYVTPNPANVEEALERLDTDGPPIPRPLPPTTHIDVGDYATFKRQALEAHATQHCDWERLLDRESENDWMTHIYLHRAYPPVAANEPPETVLYE